MASGQQDLFIDAPIWYEGLTGPRRYFVECFCTDRTCFLNATAAYIKAYGGKGGKELAGSSIQSNASRLMRDPKIKDAIARLLRARQNEEDRLNEFRVLQMLQTLALYDPKDIIDNYGNLKKDISQLGDLSFCIAGIKTTRNGGKEIKLYDKTKALEMLSRYLDIIRPIEGAAAVNQNVYLVEKDVAVMGEAEKAEYEVVGAAAK
jgi:hypothetical protein